VKLLADRADVVRTPLEVGKPGVKVLLKHTHADNIVA